MMTVACAGTAWAQSFEFIVPPAGASNGSTSSFAMSDDGTAIGGRAGGSSLPSALWRWTEPEGAVSLGVPAGSNGNGFLDDFNFDGTVAVGGVHAPGGGSNAFRWTAATGVQLLGDFSGGPFPDSRALGVSHDGSVIVGRGETASGDRAFRWTEAGGMVSLGDLPGGSSRSTANAVSADGSVVVGFGTSASGLEAFRWTEGNGMVSLGTLPGESNSQASGISSDGTTIVGSGQNQAWRWTASTGMVGIGDLPGGSDSAIAFAVSDDGGVIIGQSSSSAGTVAFLWTEADGMRSLTDVLADAGLDMTGITLFDAYDISDDGLRITGTGRNSAGQVFPYIVTLPTPSAAALLGVAGLAATRRRR